ncbi:MAG: YlxR family protein [Chloroflexi bacterium]|nr:YlxR family protein [Chloroflexota bacterium]MCI0575127.1 YlxR family protein [Chloroflexota bacterium]MCI0646276.1 YlxR family protein [Chloroflexota bacterium]MCI0728621.1 YlxR family protein [Chloroflexota bacterium]
MGARQPYRKHVPQRTCVICRQKTDKRRLTRLVRTADGGVVVDPTGKRNGRGAYLCDRITCWDKVLGSAILDQLFGVQVSDEEKEAIAAYRPSAMGEA